MSFFEGLIQGAADAAGGILDRQMQNDELLERQKAMADYNEQLEGRKQQAKMKLQAELGQRISDMSDQTRRQRIADSVNRNNGTNLTEADVGDIARNPEALKAYGIIDRTRAQEMDDRAAAAEKIGALDHAKTIREQQNIEIQRDNNERRLKADEKRNELGQAQLESRERMSQAAVDQRDRAAERRHEAAMARIDSAISKVSGKSSVDLTYFEGVRKDIASEEVNLRKQKSDDLRNVFDSARKKEIEEQYAPAFAALAKRRTQLQRDYNKKREDLGLDPVDKESDDKPVKQPGKSTPVTLPPQAVSKLKENTLTTFGNGQTWTLKNGKPTQVN